MTDTQPWLSSHRAENLYDTLRDAQVLIFYCDFERLAGKRNTLPSGNADREFGDACLHLLGNPHGAVELVISASLSKFCESLHRLLFG